MVANLVTKHLRGTADLLFRRQTSITSAALMIIVLSLASRLLGVIRYRVLAGEFGSNSPELAAFLAAFKIPDIIFQIVVIGALSTAFIPVISGFLAKRQQKEAARVFSVVVSYAMVATAIFAVIVFIFANQIARILAPGLPAETLTLTANIIRVLMFAQFFLIASNFVTGVLNSYHRFLVPAIAPVIYNLGIIFGTIFLSEPLGIFGPVVGVLLGAFGHLAVQLPLLKRFGIRFSFDFNHSVPGVREVARLMGPRTFAMTVAQVEPVVDTALASIISSTPAATNIIVFNYAFALQALPAGVFGFALGAAALPTLAKEFAQENLENFKATLVASIHQILYLVIPAAVVLVVLRVPVVRLVYGAPGFDWEATRLTALTLAAFSVGILGQSLVQLLGRGFYALHDTKTPVKITIVTVVLNIAIAVGLVYFFNNVVLLGVSSSFAGFFASSLMLYFLSKRVGGLPWRETLVPIAKMMLAGALAGLSLYTPLKILDSAAYGQLWSQGSIVHTFFGAWAIDTSHTTGLLLVTAISAVSGLAVYFLVTYILGIEEIAIFTRLFAKLRLPSLLRRLTQSPTDEPMDGSP